ncbi:MAG: glycosyltransferase [Paludibacter sp.]
MNDKIPLVSIICTTYNHENFIREALDGFVMQKANFPFEIIVHDDASTDKTAEIAKEYEEKYPYLFVNIYQNINQYSKLDVNIWTDITFPMARGNILQFAKEMIIGQMS